MGHFLDRFVYDGLTLLRVDQLYDSDEDEALEMTDGWRVWWENTTMPALLGGLLAKRVYSYPNDQSGTSNGSTDFYYAHDAIGNVIAVSDGNGARQHHFTQDAFGNRLTLDSLGGDDWDAAHEDGIWEHQTGKWFDPETGLYFFHARWVDPVVGRFVGRTVLPRHVEGAYVYCENSPSFRVDLNGHSSWVPDALPGLPDTDGKPPKGVNPIVCAFKCAFRAMMGGKSPLGMEARICFQTECTDPSYTPRRDPITPIYQPSPYPYPSGQLPPYLDPIRCTHGPHPDGTFPCQIPPPSFPSFQFPDCSGLQHIPPETPLWLILLLMLKPPFFVPA